jgi:asparagine synthase (glutamine-hydrolysing)
MSAIGAVLNFDSRPCDPFLLTDLWERLADRGPDGGNLIIEGPVGICYRAFHTNPQSRLENQPFISRNGMVLAVDGRIDNRDQLISDLRDELPGERVGITDVEIVSAAFTRWREDCLLRLIGEFALILWDPIRQTMLLARDHVGARTLYYHQDTARLICSSELEPLLSLIGTGLSVNEEYIAGYLAFDPEPEFTPYNGVYAVKPFHSISISRAGKSRERRYWGLEQTKELRYQTDREYEEHFYQHLTDAVRAPLRSDLPVFADLSGGLDSSAIVCVADKLIAAGAVSTPRLETVSQVSDSSPTSDERKFIRHVEAQRGRPTNYVREEDHPLLRSISVENAFVSLNSLLFCAEQHRVLRDLMRLANARVLLSGIGGDEITCSNPDPSPELADLLVTGRLSQLHAGLKAWSTYLRKPYVELLWRNTLLPVMPGSLRLKRMVRGNLPLLADKEFAKRTHLRERMCLPTEPFGCSSPSARDQALGFWTAARGIAAGHRREISKVDVSYPFLHRPLVEFMQAIPHTQRVRIGETRSLMRRSLKNVLPEKIRKRKSKGNPTEIVSRALAREWSHLRELFKDARVCAYGFIDHSALVSTTEGFRHGCGMQTPMLLKALTVEVWLRALEQRSTSSRPSTVAGKTRAFPQTTVQLRASSAGAQ